MSQKSHIVKVEALLKLLELVKNKDPKAIISQHYDDGSLTLRSLNEDSFTAEETEILERNGIEINYNLITFLETE